MRPSFAFLLLGVAVGACDKAATTDPPDLATVPMPDLAMGPDLQVGPDLLVGSDMASCGTAEIYGPQYPNLAAACTACVQMNCCAERAACTANAECAAVRTCFTTCNVQDTACAANCQAAHPNGKTDSGALSSCRSTKCGALCANYVCAGTITWPAPAMATVMQKLILIDYQAATPIAGAMVRVCGTGDATCANPLANGTSATDGSVTLAVPTAKGGFGAYLEITEKDHVSTIYYHGTLHPERVGQDSISPVILSKATFMLITGFLSVMPDANRGNLLFGSIDCSAFNGAGLQVKASTADTMSTTGYIAGGLPSKTAMATDNSGRGGIFNLPPGMTNLTATVAANGTTLGTLPALVRAGWATSMTIPPTP